MSEEYLMDAVELYYIKDLRSKRWTGVRWAKEIRDQIAEERRIAQFVDGMHIVILKLLIRCFNRRAKK